MAAIRRFTLRLLSFFRSNRAETELSREIAAHLRLMEEQFIAQGMSADEARYAAKRAFGGVEQVKERQRDVRSFRVLDSCWLDLKLGVRMLVKYPGLTLVAGLGMAVAIAVCASCFAFFYASLHPTLPLDEGERIVGLENWDAGWNNQEYRSLHDFHTWRAELAFMEEVAAFQTIRRNLLVPGAQPLQAVGAEMTASGFRIAREAPLLGRTLTDDDERKGALDVVVIGHEVWRTRFGSDPAVLGRTLRVGTAIQTVVGVMPERFAFPMNQSFWLPLRADPLDYEQRRGPDIITFGRLAPGATLEQARAELHAIGERAAAAFPKTHERLRPRIVPYTQLWFDDAGRSEFHFLQFVITLLVVVVGVNVAILISARTATRHGEILIRTALGASRRRIVGQLFIEALVLSLVAATAGLLLARLALAQADVAVRQVGERFFGGLPFWMTFELSSGTVLYAIGLAVFAAGIAGVLPALKATGRRTQSGLSQLSGGTEMRLGTTWTSLIVVQVAFAVAVLPGAVYTASQSVRLTRTGPGFAAQQYLMARPVLDEEVPSSADAAAYWATFRSRYVARVSELIRRIQAEPGVAGVTTATTAPGNEYGDTIEIDGAARPPESASGHRVRTGQVGVDFFAAFDVAMLTGRPFRSEDVEIEARSGEGRIIVNQLFVQRMLGPGNPLGRRLRYVRDVPQAAGDQRWYEIVGVVPDFPPSSIAPEPLAAKVYHPLVPAEAIPVSLFVRMRSGSPETFATRLREITIALDPALQLTHTLPLEDVYGMEQNAWHWGALAFAVVTLSVLLLSAAGIYALISLTVTRRRKEIGIRVALGADRREILQTIFSRAAAQLGIGVLAGIVAALLIDRAAEGEFMGMRAVVILPAIAVFMAAVGLLAAFGPAQRAFRVNPTESLKQE